MTANTTGERVTSRPLAGLDDFMRVRDFLLETYALYGTYYNWEIRRWEGQWYWGTLERAQEWARYVRLWETGGRLIGVAHPEGEQRGNAWLQIHPDYRHLEPEMLDWCETALATPGDDGRLQLALQVYSHDDARQQMLRERGYQQLEGYGVLRWREPGQTIPDAPAPEGYLIRSMRPDNWNDTVRWSEVERAVFRHADTTPEGLARLHTSPSYRSDLHIVAEARDGSFAAFAGLTFEPVHRTAIFEPVGTHPNHLRKGLAAAVMREGLRRLAALDVSRVYVGTGDSVPANRLYESLGFTEHHVDHTWRKLFA